MKPALLNTTNIMAAVKVSSSVASARSVRLTKSDPVLSSELISSMSFGLEFFSVGAGVCIDRYG